MNIYLIRNFFFKMPSSMCFFLVYEIVKPFRTVRDLELYI
jgi:hypothetical protein